MLDEDEVLELVDQLRFNMPEEMKQANWTVQEQQRVISEAHVEAARIMSKANERAEQAVKEHEIVRRAEREAQQGLREAKARSEQIVREAEIYALEQLQQLEAHLTRTLGTVKRGVEALQASTAASRPEPPDPAAAAEERMEQARF